MAVLKQIKKNQDRLKFGRSNAKSSAYDELNKKIIGFLQEEGRMPFKDIAKALNVSEGTIRNRV